MFSRIFPKQIDNNYRGHWLAIWILALVALLKAVQGVNSIVMTRRVMTGADGIPLDSFNPVAADAAIAMFALLGMYLLILPLLSAVVLIRYRAMIPLMFVMQLLVQLAGRALLMINPIDRSAPSSMSYGGHPIGIYVNLAILVMTVAGLVLSLMNNARAPERHLAEGAR